MNRAHIAGLGLTMLLGGACGPPSDPVAPDAATQLGDGPDPDTRGLTLRFSSSPQVPGEVEHDGREIELDTAEIQLSDLRALADTTPDERTTEPSVTLAWGEGSSCGDDECVVFPQAPPGLYSLVVARVVSIRIEGDFEAAGSADGGSEETNVTIRAEGLDLEIEVPFSPVSLQPGSSAAMHIQVRVADLVRAVDWDAVIPDADGDLEVDGADPQFPAVLSALGDAFRAQ